MNKLHLAIEAQQDLAEIKHYISDDLENPVAAASTVKKITQQIRILRDHAWAGPLLSSIADVDDTYRFLVSGSYMIFYRVDGEDIYIDRVIYGRRDYLRLFDSYNE